MKKNIKSVGVLLLSSIMLMSSPLTVLAEENETVQTQENGSIDLPENNGESESQASENSSEDSTIKEEKQQEILGQEDVQENVAPTTVQDMQEEPEAVAENDEQIQLKYRAYLHGGFWQEEKQNGEMAGTTGQNRAMRALQIKIDNQTNVTGGIEYSAHVQNIGWQDAVKDGETAGIEEKNLPIEAIRMNLTGDLKEQYDIYYRVHATNVGWLGWAKNGEDAGTAGYAYAVQAIEIKLYNKTAEDKPAQTERSFLSEETRGLLMYKTHVQNIGWQDKVYDGDTAGTTGRNLNLEALQLKVTDAGRKNMSGSISYEAHVQDIGWQNAVYDWGTAGTTGRNKKIEALKISLTGELAQAYDIYYRVHSAEYGWLGWAKNGEQAGTIGLNLGAQAIEVKLYAKDATDKPEQNSRSYISQDNLGAILYKAHVQNIGWQSNVYDGKTAGTTGRNLSVEALNIKVTDWGRQNGLKGSVIYQTHVQDIGWQDEVADGETSGTTGKNKKVEAIKVRLSGELEEKYDIYYRVHSARFGWLGWTKNGETAGTVGYNAGVEAVEIKLYEKNDTNVPDTTARSYLATENIGEINFAANVEKSGWQTTKTNGQIVGTTGENKAIQQLTMSTSDSTGKNVFNGTIEYRLHVSNVGWMDWKNNGEIAGDGKNQAEAVQIRLTGELAQYADIYYRTHVSNYGWLGWAKNGQEAGTTKLGNKLQAIQVKIVPKGAMAPGSNSNYYITMTPQQIRINNGIQNVYNQAGRNLYSCFMWCVNNIKYRTLGDNPGTGYTNPQWFALYGLEQKIGDCRTYAATFYQLAKGLGYNARYVYGYVPRAGGGMVDHAWVEIDINGVTYVYDTDFQYETGRNGYQFRYKTSGTWVYTNYHYES